MLNARTVGFPALAGKQQPALHVSLYTLMALKEQISSNSRRIRTNVQSALIMNSPCQDTVSAHNQYTFRIRQINLIYTVTLQIRNTETLPCSSSSSSVNSLYEL